MYCLYMDYPKTIMPYQSCSMQHTFQCSKCLDLSPPGRCPQGAHNSGPFLNKLTRKFV